MAFHAIQTVGIVPPSMTYSVPVMEEARSDAKNAVADALVDVAPAGRHSFSDPPESIQAPCDGTWISVPPLRSKDKARGKYTANEMRLEVHSAGAGRGPAPHAIRQRPGRDSPHGPPS